MNLKERCDCFMSLLVFKCVNGIVPSYLHVYDVSIGTRASSIDHLLYVQYVNWDFLNNPSTTGPSGTIYLVI